MVILLETCCLGVGFECLFGWLLGCSAIAVCYGLVFVHVVSCFRGSLVLGLVLRWWLISVGLRCYCGVLSVAFGGWFAWITCVLWGCGCWLLVGLVLWLIVLVCVFLRFVY